MKVKTNWGMRIEDQDFYNEKLEKLSPGTMFVTRWEDPVQWS